MYYLHFNELSK
jgi:hypothetical protein